MFIKKYLVSALILLFLVLIAYALDGLQSNGLQPNSPASSGEAISTIQEQGEIAPTSEIDENLILPQEGVLLPVVWGDLGAQMVAKGVIDGAKFESIYSQRGGLDDEMKKILYGSNNGEIKMTPQNAGFLLNIFWALGLGNKNSILETGPMSDPKYGGAGNFASTGGWTLAKGGAMAHYSKYGFVSLTPAQQEITERVSQGIYRPCCGNSTYFPDCNHGMAMLGLIELMASRGVSEEEMYKIALKVNSYWFPDTYLVIAQYLQEKKGISFDEADPKEILGKNYSSGQGFQAILKQVIPLERKGGGGCGV